MPPVVKPQPLLNRPLVQPNIHPEAARSSGKKPAQARVAQPLGGGWYVLPVGGSRPKP